MALLPKFELISKICSIQKKMESTEIAIFSTIFGLVLALIDAYIERNIPG